MLPKYKDIWMKLQFTNGYRPRFDQISRILQLLFTQEERKKIPQQEIVNALGVPTNQVENLISMMIGFGLVVPRVNTITPLGKAIIQADPYFEKVETLWMIHYTVSSNPKWVVWYRIVNNAIPTLDRFTVELVSRHFFADLASQFSERTISEKLPKEVGAVLASYTRSELSRLGLLELGGAGHFVRGNPAEVSSLVFLYCLLDYRDRYSPGSSALNVEDICLAQNSPGRVFNLPEYQVRTSLSESHSNGLIRLEQFANLDQVRFSDTLTLPSVLAQIYRG
jgi:hypothetical protein